MSEADIEVVHTVVFADGVGGGNPCPVVLDASELSTDEMQAVAGRFGQECGFVVSPPQDDVPRLRFFVPEHEMSMCVHATAAVVALLAQRGRLPRDVDHVQAPVGRVGIGYQRATVVGETNVQRVSVTQHDPTFSSANPSREQVAAVLGVPVAAIDSARPVESVSVSRPKLIVPIKDARTLHGLAPDWERLWRLCERFDTTGIYAFAAAEQPASWFARQFPVRAGYPEDPATGVAAGALAAYLIAHAPPVDRQSIEMHVYQGQAMGRPSRLDVSGTWSDDRVSDITVSGLVSVSRHHVAPAV
ncbi:MAG: PhzF family phenazine biosynthesis protein [Mycobacterium sp.]